MQYIKQYGAKRTGTNYLRALIEQNFDDAIVLMHVLGGKHNPAVDLQNFLSNNNNDPENFVVESTAAQPAENFLPFTVEKKQFMSTHSNAIYEAVDKKQIHYLISIKDPYSWIYSNKDPYSWINRNYRQILGAVAKAESISIAHALVKLKTREFNALYSSYFELYQKYPQQATIVRYEDILTDPSGFLNSLSTKLGLIRCSSDYNDVSGIAIPTDWDKEKSSNKLDKQIFNKDFYSQKKYLNHLSAEIISIVNQEMDWELLEKYGYNKQK